MSNQQIHSKAMLVSIKLSAWTARKFDRQITEDVTKKHNASPDAGRFNKYLLCGDDAKSYKAVVAACTAARNEHYHQTLPWSDEGPRLLPAANFIHYSDLMRQRKADFDSAVSDFIAEYPTLRKNAKKKLNGMYCEADYPDVAEIGNYFAMTTDITPLPNANDIRLDLPADQIKIIEANVASRIEQSTKVAMQDAWSRLHDRVSKLHNRLSDPDAAFRDSLIDHVREVTDVLKRLNVTSDPDLEALRAQVEGSLASLDPTVLRTDAQKREAAVNAAQQIMSEMSIFYDNSKGGAQ